MRRSKAKTKLKTKLTMVSVWVSGRGRITRFINLPVGKGEKVRWSMDDYLNHIPRGLTICIGA